MATVSELITKFELQVNDVTELSTSEEVALLNRIYFRVCSDRPWEFLKTSVTGTVLTDSTGSYITLPSDFGFFTENAQVTNNAFSYQGNASPKVIFIVANNAYTPYQIVNYSDRRAFYNTSGYCYLDLANSKIRFTYPPPTTTYEFDYCKVPPVLTSSDTPVIPTRFQDILVFGMASENDIIQISPKATSYAPENQAKYNQYLQDLAYYNAQLQYN